MWERWKKYWISYNHEHVIKRTTTLFTKGTLTAFLSPERRQKPRSQKWPWIFSAGPAFRYVLPCLRKQERSERMAPPGASHYTFVEQREPSSSFGNHILQVSASPRWLEVHCSVITHNRVNSTVGIPLPSLSQWVGVPMTSQIWSSHPFCQMSRSLFLRGKKSSSLLQTQLFWHGLEVLRDRIMLSACACFYGNTGPRLSDTVSLHSKERKLHVWGAPRTCFIFSHTSTLGCVPRILSSI